MRYRLYLLLFACSLCVIPLQAEQQLLRMEAELTYDEIFLGEPTYLTLHVHGYQPSFGEPDLSAMPADIELLGQQDRSQQIVRIVNGVQQVTRFTGRTFTYRILPHETGTFAIGPIILEAPDGNPIPVNTPTLEVKSIPIQSYVELWVSAPTNTVIVDEEFDVTLFVRIRKLPPPFRAHSPMHTVPHLRIPYLDLHPGEGLKSENITQLLQRILVREGESFRINDRVVGRDPFGGIFGREERARFRLPRVTDPDDNHYFRYELKSRWSADREGDYTFGPVRFHGNIITQVEPDGNAAQSEIYAIGDPVTVQVRNPPRTGRPPTFIGASGSRFSMETSLDTQICQAGDPVTLTIDITGDGSANRIRSPRPETLASLEADFRIQPEPIRTSSISGGRRFEYLIRPRQAGTWEIPPLEIAYFDLESRSYVTVQSDPLPIRVTPSEDLEHEMISGLPIRAQARHRFTAPPGDLPPAPFGVRSMDTARFFIPALHIPLLLLGPLVFLLACIKQWVPKHIPAIQAYMQRKRAFDNAMQQLQRSDCDTVTILRTYLTTTLTQSFARGDTEAMRQDLQRLGLAASDIETVIEILTETAYAGQNKTDAAHIKKIIDSLARAQRARKMPFYKHMLGKLGVGFMIMLTTGLTCLAQADQIARFEERRSNLLLLRAQTPEEFIAVAHALADRIDQGNYHPVVLYNLGTALLLAEQPSLALPLLQWAERRGANTWSTRRNMLIAQRNLANDPTAQLPWIRSILFWHYRTSIPNRITIATSLFSLLWLWITIRRRYRHINWFILPTMGMLLLLAISIVASLYAEHQSRQDWQLQRRQIQRIYALHHEENAL